MNWSRGWGAVELLENSGVLLGSDSNPMVRHLQHDLSVLAVETQLDIARIA